MQQVDGMRQFAPMARILHLVAANHRRGAETFAVELAEHLRVHDHDVRVLAIEDAGVAAPLDVEIAGGGRRDVRGLARVLRAARWADVVVGFGSTSLLVGAAAAWASRRPFVYRTIGDPSVWGEVRGSNLRVGAPARSAARVVALYPAAGSELTRRYKVSPGAIRVIPRGVPTDPFAPVDSEARRRAAIELRLDPAVDWVAYVGALSAEKDPLLALEAIEAVGRRPRKVGLVLAGGGPLESEVAAAARAGVAPIVLLGPVDDVRPVYAASRALLLPSLTEGIPGAAVEAGLCGLPVVSFDVGGVGSVVLDGSTGRLVPTRDPSDVAGAVEDALDHAEAFGAAARQHCLDRFSMAVVGDQWLRLIDELHPG
jgi:glycosyltransferase involved in cell wall biosynthesis